MYTPAFPLSAVPLGPSAGYEAGCSQNSERPQDEAYDDELGGGVSVLGWEVPGANPSWWEERAKRLAENLACAAGQVTF